MMVGPLVTNGRPRLALVRVGRAEVDQASRARAQLVVGEIVLARKVRVSIFVSYEDSAIWILHLAFFSHLTAFEPHVLT